MPKSKAKVLDLGVIRIAREKRAIDESPKCSHRSISLDEHGQVVICNDCHTQVSAFWALQMLTEYWDEAVGRLAAREKAVTAEVEACMHILAAGQLAKAWKSSTAVPSCPHCHRGVLPTDGFGGAMISRSVELAIREAKKKKQDQD